MEIVCENCGRHYKIADNKLPARGRVYFTCPNCRGRIEVKAPVQKGGLMEIGGEDTIRPPDLESFDPGVKTALVYCSKSQIRDKLWKGLEDLGYEVRSVHDREEIRSRFRYHVYDLVFLYQSGPDPDSTLSGIQRYIDTLSMDIRRNTFVVYIYPGGNRLDSLQAFSRGVDMTLGPIELKDLVTILPQALEVRDAFYRVYLECKARVEASAAEPVLFDGR